MALDVETIGLAMDTSGVERGIKSLDELASRGPKVEQSLKGVENAAKQAGQGVSTLGSTNAQGLEKVGTASQQAAQGLGKMGQAAQSAVSSQAALARAVDSFTQAENKYIQSLLDEAKQIGMTRAEREAYIAQSRGMSQSAQEIAAAVGKKIDALKREQEELGRLNKATGDTSDSLVSLARVSVQAFVGSVLVSGIKSASQAMYEASAQAERFRTTLNFATGGRGAQEIDYLRRVTGELGLQFASTAQAYSGFQAAARGTALEGQKAKDVFESIAKASAVMGLSAEQSGGVLLALQQMISKGTVQAEELRGQLGERLPGAFQIAAKAMGVTTAELGKMLEQGQVVASDFLPKFAKALEENLGGAAEKAADRLDAATNRYANALDRLKQSAGDSGISQFWAGQINILTDGMQGVANAMDMARAQGKGFAGQMAAAAGAAAQFANPLNALSYSAQDAGIKLKDAEARLEELRAAGAKGSSNLMLREAYSHAQRLVDKYREAKAAQDALLGGGGADPRDIPATMTRGASYGRWAQEQKESEQKMLEIRMRQSGVNKQYLQELKDLEQALARQVITQDEYTQRVSALAKTTWDASVAGKAAAKTSSERASAAKAEQSTYDKLISSIQTKIAQNEAEIAGGAKLSENQKLRIKYAEDLQGSLKGITAAQRSVIEGYLDEHKAAEQANVAAREAMKAAQETAAARNREAAGIDAWVRAQEDAARQSLKSVQDRINSMEDEERAIELSQALNVSLAEAIELVAIARLEEKQAGFYEGSEGWLAIQREIDARRELLGLIGSKEAREANKRAADEAAKDWERTAQTISDTLADYIMSGGKDAAQYLKRLFATLVLQPTVQVLVGSVLGTGPAAAASTGSSIMGLANNASSLNTLYGTASQAIVGGTAGASAASLGYANAVGMLGGDAIGALAAANGMWAGVATGAQAAAQSAIAANLALEAGTAAALPAGTISAATGGAAAGGGISGALASIPGWGWAAAGVVAVLGSVLSRKTEKRGGGLMGVLGEEGGVHDLDLMRKGGSLVSGPKWFVEDRGTSAMDKALQDTYSAQRDALMKMGDALGLATDGLKGFTTTLGSDELGDAKVRGLRLDGLSDQEAQAKIAAALATASNEMAEQIIGSWETVGGASTYKPSEFARDGEKAIDTLARLSGNITIVNTAFESLGTTLYDASLAGADMAGKLADLFGGLGQFSQSTGVYMQNFYSAEEQRDVVRRQLERAFEGLDLKLPDIDASDAREQFRAIAEAQDLTTESGRETWAALMNLSGAFASVTESSETAAAAAARLADEQAKAAEKAAEAAARAAEKAAEDAARAYEKALAYLTKTAETAMQILGAAVDREKQTQQAGYEAQIAIIDAQRKAATTAMDAQREWLGVAIGGAQDYAKALESEAARIRGYFTGMVLQDNPDAPAGASVFAAQAALRAGDKSDAVLRKATDIDPEMFASWADYAVNFFETQGLVRGATQDAERAASMAYSDVALLEQQLTLAEDKYKADLEHYTKLEGIAKETLDSNLLRLDALVQSAQDQLAEATGTKLAVMTIAQAMGNFSGAIGKLAYFTGNAITTPLPTAPVLTPFGSQTADLSYAPPVVYSPVAYGGSGQASSNDRVVAALQDVLAELQALRSTGADTKAAVEKTAALIDQVTAGGNAMLTETA